MNVNGQKDIKFLMDSGATCCVMSLETLKEIIPNKIIKLKKSGSTLRAFNGSIMKPIGRIRLKCQRKDVTRDIDFEIIKYKIQPILSA